MNIVTVFSLFGGLGLFLYGMKLMSEALEKAAGAKMRSILEFFTKNRLMGTIVGIIFTAIIQSSNATTVMVVSFVNSGLMTLAQASGVIMGANIGTTVTAQLIAFNLSDIAPLFVIIGVIMVMFCKPLKVKRFGEVILGFGILFMGLTTMSSSMVAFRESPTIVNFLSSLHNHTLAILTGFVLTAVLQSSSATVGIILLMATQGLLELPMCFFMILGCNIGACMSAMLVSLSGRKEAKQAAWIHFLFNIIGSLVIYIVLSLALDPITDWLYAFSGNDIGRAVANAHTLIKVIEVIMMFPFMNLIVKATYKIVPGTDEDQVEGHELMYINLNKVLSPTTALVDVLHEIKRMGNMAIENLQDGMEALLNCDEEKVAKVKETEKVINFLNEAITSYLIKVNQLDLPMADADLLGGLYHVVNDLERVGDHAENMADSASRRIKNQVVFSEKAVHQMEEMLKADVEILRYALEMFTEMNQAHLREIQQLEDQIDELERKYQNAHIKRLTKGKCTPEAGMIFSDTISGLERVADHATNIAFAVMEPAGGDVNLDELV